jgi:hypothetical protein
MNRVGPPSGTTVSQVTKRSVNNFPGGLSSAKALRGGSDATCDEKQWLRGARRSHHAESGHHQGRARTHQANLARLLGAATTRPGSA